MGVLDEIVAHKRSELAELKPRRPLPDLIAACRGLAPARDFEAALRPAPGERVRLIAEVKRGSPSRGLFRADLDPVAQAGIYAGAGAAAVSVLTDARYFHGSLDDLVRVRAAVSVPVLRKEFIVDEYQLWEARAAGADAVLLIVAALDDAALRDLLHAAKGAGLATLVEVHTAGELDRALRLGAPVIGVNNRDLQTLTTSLDPSLRLLPQIPPGPLTVSESGLATLVEVHTAAELDRALRLGAPVIGVNNRDLQTLTTTLAPSLALLPQIPPGPIAVSESGLRTGADVAQVVAAGAHAVLVGETLLRADDVAAKVRELSLR